MVVIGGAKSKTAEKRAWNETLGDYEFTPVHIEGQELIEDPSCYDSALATFHDVVTDKDLFPDINEHSRIIFGNEVDCFLIEVKDDINTNFYMSPMRLQQKTGQKSIRVDSNTIYLVGGTDTSRTKISSKFYRFLIKSKEVTELPKLKEGRYFPQFVCEGNNFFVLGGKVKGGSATASVEWLNLGASPDDQKWETVAPMKQPRFGHVAWVNGGKLYVLGGTIADKGKPLEECEVFDLATKKWSIHPSKIT